MSEEDFQLKQIVHQLADDVRDALSEVKGKMDFLGRDVSATQAALREVAEGRKPSSLPEMQTSPDRLWLCPGCGSKLGVYDPSSDVIRIKYKDQFVSFHAGTGGWLEIGCRSCGRWVKADNTDG